MSDLPPDYPQLEAPNSTLLMATPRQAFFHALIMVAVITLVASLAWMVQWWQFRAIATQVGTISQPAGPRFSHQQLQNLPPQAQSFLKAHIREGTPLYTGASFNIVGTHRSDLSNPWLSFTGRFDIRGQSAYLWNTQVKMGVLPIHHWDFLLPKQAGSKTTLMGVMPLDSRKGTAALESNRARLMLESVLVPTLLVPGKNHRVLWREYPSGALAYSLPKLAPKKWVTIKLDKRGHLLEAKISRLADFLAKDRSKNFTYALKTLGFPKNFGGVTMPTAVALGWHGVYDEQELPYPDMEKPQPDGFAEMTRYKINSVEWLPTRKTK